MWLAEDTSFVRHYAQVPRRRTAALRLNSDVIPAILLTAITTNFTTSHDVQPKRASGENNYQLGH